MKPPLTFAPGREHRHMSGLVFAKQSGSVKKQQALKVNLHQRLMPIRPDATLPSPGVQEPKLEPNPVSLLPYSRSSFSPLTPSSFFSLPATTRALASAKTTAVSPCCHASHTHTHTLPGKHFHRHARTRSHVSFPFYFLSYLSFLTPASSSPSVCDPHTLSIRPLNYPPCWPLPYCFWQLGVNVELLLEVITVHDVWAPHSRGESVSQAWV